MKKLTLLVCALMGLWTGGDARADKFDIIKNTLASGACTRLEFWSVIESEIFDQVDSTRCQAYVAADGRYRLELGPDTYVATGDKLYSYSPANNQVTVETMAPEQGVSSEISVMTRLDVYYKTVIIDPDSRYLLTLRPADAGSLPDSLDVFLDSRARRIEQITYYDINEELNRLVFIEMVPLDTCDTTRFVPDFPDSVETVELW